LGFKTFEAWASSMPKYQLRRDERKALVTELDGIGMTQRQIAAAVGAGQKTVSRDLESKDSKQAPTAVQKGRLGESNDSGEARRRSAARRHPSAR
jgi:transposase